MYFFVLIYNIKQTVMVTEQGIIKEINNDKAIVKVKRSSACEHCSARGTCGMSFGTESSNEILIEVKNSLNARVGDKVELSIPSGSLVKIAIMVYIFPIFSLLFGAYEGGNLAIHFGVNSTLGSIIGAGALLIISFLILRKVDKAIKKKDSYNIRMTRIIS